MHKTQNSSIRKIIDGYQAHFQLLQGILFIALKTYKSQKLLTARFDHNNMPLKVQDVFNSPSQLFQIIRRLDRSHFKVLKDEQLMIKVKQYGYRMEYLLPLEKNKGKLQKSQATIGSHFKEQTTCVQKGDDESDDESQKEILELIRQNTILKQKNKENETKIHRLEREIERLMNLSKDQSMCKTQRCSETDFSYSKEMVHILQEKIVNLQQKSINEKNLSTKCKLLQQQMKNQIQDLKSSLQQLRQKFMNTEKQLGQKRIEIQELKDQKQNQKMEIDILYQKIHKKNCEIQLLNNEIKVLQVELIKQNQRDQSQKHSIILDN